jgi:PAS domain S-box-containing protein
LSDNAARLRLALDAGRMALWDVDVTTDTLTGDANLNRLFGYPPDMALTMGDLRARYFPGERRRLQETFTAVVAKGERFLDVEFRCVWPDGQVRWLLRRAEVHFGADGRPKQVLGVVLDITDRKRAEEQVRFQAHLLDSVEEAVVATDLEGRVVYWNWFAERLYGWSAQEALGGHVLDLTSASERTKAEATFERLRNGGSWSGEFTGKRRDGSTFPGHVTDAPVRNEYGELIAIVGTSYDISARKRWEEQQQLLINELNHRVKNTLATVQSIAAQTLRNARSPGQAREDLESRLIALSRAHDVLTRESWEGAMLGEVVSVALDPYRARGENRFRISGPEVRLPPRVALPVAMALQELVTNAVKHGSLSNEAGEVHLTWKVVEGADTRELRLCWQECGGPEVAAPKRRGFGTRLIERGLGPELGGTTELSYETPGLVFRLTAPLPA